MAYCLVTLEKLAVAFASMPACRSFMHGVHSEAKDHPQTPEEDSTTFAGCKTIKSKGIELAGVPMYLDMQATTPMDPRVLDVMLPYLTNTFGNPHSRTHLYGWESEDAVELARTQVASLIGVTSTLQCLTWSIQTSACVCLALARVRIGTILLDFENIDLLALSTGEHIRAVRCHV
jgi:hypothetical protein